MTPKKQKNPTNLDILNEVQGLKGMVANQGKQLKQHSDDIAGLKKINEQKAIAEKAAKQAVEEYKKSEAQKLPDNTWLTKELLSVIIKLIAVVAALIALWKVGGTAGK